MIIRDVTEKDASRLLEIYAPYIEKTAITFEIVVPSVQEFQNRIHSISCLYPYIVIEEDGMIIGYAYASSFNERAAYCHCCELSIYLDDAFRGKGYGRMLYDDLEKKLKDMKILNLYACIASTRQETKYLSNASELFHEKMGFHKVGEFHQCGYKFQHWFDMIYMEKFLGAHI